MPARVGAPRGVGSIPGLGNSPGEGNGCLLQYSCLGNPVDRGVLWATVHGITKSRTRLILPTLYPHPDEGYRDCRSEKQHWDKASLERAVTVTLRVLSPLLLGEPPAGSRVGGTAAILFCSQPLPMTGGLSPNLLPPQTPSLTIWVKLPIQYFIFSSTSKI